MRPPLNHLCERRVWFAVGCLMRRGQNCSMYLDGSLFPQVKKSHWNDRNESIHVKFDKAQGFCYTIIELNNLPMESTRETGSMTVQQPAYARC